MRHRSGCRPSLLPVGSHSNARSLKEVTVRYFALLRERMGFNVADARVVNLRSAYPKNRDGMRMRAHETRTMLRDIVRRDPSAPNLIDGAVLDTEIGGIAAHFEADSLAARFGGEIHTGEVKSFPVVDGRTEPDKLGSALDQAAIYTLLTARTVETVGGDPAIVSPKALLITPRNVGLRPTLLVMDVSQRIERTELLLSRAPDIRELARELPPGTSFGPVADAGSEPERRIETLQGLADQVGTRFISSCVADCGLYRFCRARASACDSPSLVGEKERACFPGLRRSPGRPSWPLEPQRPRPSDRSRSSSHWRRVCTAGPDSRR